MSDKIHFGSPSCSSIEVDPFTPICSYPDIGTSSALSLDVPVPRFAPIIPPNECACFDFSTGTVTPTVASCLEQAYVSIEIRPLDADCCTGRYGIFPSVSLPCMPFDVATPTVNVHTKTGDTGNVDGNASFQIKKGNPPNCCQLETTLDITLPECVKTVPDPVEQQITWTDNTGAAHSHQLVSLVRDAQNCTVYPTVTPLPLPDCLLRDGTLCSGNFSLDRYGGSATWTLTRTNCDISLDIQASPGTIPIPGVCTTELQMRSPNLTVSYTDGEGETKTKTINDFFTLARDPAQGGCPCYTMTMGTLDLTEIGGAGITNGGDVFQDSNTKQLWIDGDLDEGESYWHGGGYGNKTADDITSTFSRGPRMRNNAPTPSALTALYGSTDISIPITPSYPYQQLLDGSNHTATLWMSTRTDEFDYPAGAVTGNLSIVMPTGMQWHDRGIALTLSEFKYNQSGVLSALHEKNEGALLSPGPAISLQRNNLPSGRNASGLSLWPKDATDKLYRTTGLSINDGIGLRVYGIGTKTDVTKSLTSSRIGKLEINYGRGISAHAEDTSARNGKLEVRRNSYDFMFYSPSKTGTATRENEEDAKLSLRDTTNSAQVMQYSTSKYPLLSDDTWYRTKATAQSRSTDIIIPVVTSVDYQESSHSFGRTIAWLRFTDTGILLAATYSWSVFGEDPTTDLPTNSAYDNLRVDQTKTMTDE